MNTELAKGPPFSPRPARVAVPVQPVSHGKLYTHWNIHGSLLLAVAGDVTDVLGRLPVCQVFSLLVSVTCKATGPILSRLTDTGGAPVSTDLISFPVV